MPDFSNYMKNLSERLQEHHQMMADAAHARGEKSPMEKMFESIQQTIDAETRRKQYEEYMEKVASNL